MITLIIPLQIPGQNVRERWHWRKQRAEVSAWEFHIKVFYRSLTGKPCALIAPAPARALVTIKSYRRQRFHDEGNLVGGAKGAIDGLVRTGLIRDDKKTCAVFAYDQATLATSPRRAAVRDGLSLVDRPAHCTVITLQPEGLPA